MMEMFRSKVEIMREREEALFSFSGSFKRRYECSAADLEARIRELGYAAPIISGGYAQLEIEVTGARHEFCLKWAWAIPSEEALRVVAALSPIIEMGAGTGFWAAKLQELGADVLPFDLNPPAEGSGHHGSNNDWHSPGTWTKVYRGGVPRAGRHSDRTLLLCWPPYDTKMAYESLRAYQGSQVVYVGENSGGCTGDEAFHNRLYRDWEQVKEVDIPQWPGIHDTLTVWRRK